MSIVDELKEELSSQVWDLSVSRDEPSLKSPIGDAIRELARKLVKGYKVGSAYLVGSLTSFRYTDTSDMDVTLILDGVSDEKLEELRDKTKKINGTLAPGTKHPINFYLVNEAVSLNRFDSAYDLINKKWLKPPKDYGIDLFTIYDQFKGYVSEIDDTKSEAVRSLIDIENLRDAWAKGGEIDVLRYKLIRRYKDLDRAIEELAAKYDEAHQDRIREFKRFSELAAMGIEAVPSPNLLPSNIRYKLLERYHYLDFMKKLREIVGDDKKVNTPEDRKQARDAILGHAAEMRKEIDVDNLSKALGLRRHIEKTDTVEQFLREGHAAEVGLTPDKVDKDELWMGTEIEQEHTKDLRIAQKIAMDHLAETQDLPVQYYTGLVLLEKFLKSLKGLSKEQVVEKMNRFKELAGEGGEESTSTDSKSSTES